jgi:hypothetical protein
MKSSTHIYASLGAILVAASQSAIATPIQVSPQHSIDWHHSPLSLGAVILPNTQAGVRSTGRSKTASLKSLFDDLSADALENKCDAKQIDLNKDGKDEVFIRTTEAPSCGGGGRCSFTIDRRQGNKYQTILSGITTSPDFAMLGTQTNGWRDIATRSYLGKEFWSVWKFDGKEYKVVSQKDIGSISNSKITKSKPCSKILSGK